jgi:hypothetical protein
MIIFPNGINPLLEELCTSKNHAKYSSMFLP